MVLQVVHLPELRRRGVDVVTGDLRDSEKLRAVVSGCTAIVNASGVIKNTSQYTIESVNVEATAALVDVAIANGVQRFIHLSCLGARQRSNSRYLRSKWQSEKIVEGGNFSWTILRPSLVFGPESHMSKILDFWTKYLPIIVASLIVL